MKLNSSKFNNKYKIRGDTTILFLTSKGKIHECYIDTEDLTRLIDYDLPWHLQWDKKNQWHYVVASERYGEPGNRKGRTVYLHRFITKTQNQKVWIDHINHNTLDNRKINLKVTTNQINSINRDGANKNSKTGVRNVSYIEKLDEYWVQIMKGGERFKWVFKGNQFKEACEFAKQKHKEIFGELLYYKNN